MQILMTMTIRINTTLRPWVLTQCNNEYLQWVIQRRFTIWMTTTCNKMLGGDQWLLVTSNDDEKQYHCYCHNITSRFFVMVMMTHLELILLLAFIDTKVTRVMRFMYNDVVMMFSWCYNDVWWCIMMYNNDPV